MRKKKSKLDVVLKRLLGVICLMMLGGGDD